MGSLNNFWQEYGTKYESANTTTDANDFCAYPERYDTGSGVCPYDYWIPWTEPYMPYYPPMVTYYPSENKTEQAFKILKLLVEEKIIREPSSFKKFCELIEKLAKVI